MESTSNISSLNQEMNFCKHIKTHHHNSFVNNYIIPKREVKMKNFYNLRDLSVYKGIFCPGESKNYIDEYMIRNINMEWVALSNPSNLSMNSINREGCIFTIAFNTPGNIMAASNHNHQIEIWDMNARKVNKTMKDHKEIVTGIEFFHGESNNFMSCSLDKTIKLWKNYENVHTFLDHSDWVRCISLSKDNQFFLSGCVSSVVKLWDLEERKVLMTINNPNPDPDLLNTVNSLQFMNKDDNVFLCGLRNGTVKVFDKRVYSPDTGCLVNEFKAHTSKLNSIKFNRNDKFLLSSGRDSRARLWDLRKLPDSADPEVCIQSSINEYRGHTCKGFNIDCNFFMNEQYILTGSEDSHVYIYDVSSTKLVKKIKTHQKCVNLVKPLPECWPYSFVFTGLEDISIHIWGVTKSLCKNITKLHSTRNNNNLLSTNPSIEPSEYDETPKFEERESNMQIKLIEEIMAECGDLILRIFHSNNLTYSNGMNFENLLEIIQKNNDQESMKIMQMLNEKMMKKVMESIINSGSSSSTKNKKSEITSNRKVNKNVINVFCSNCDEDIYKSYYDIKMLENRIQMEGVMELLDLPNNYNSFSELSECTNSETDKYEDTQIQIKKLYSHEDSAIKYNYIYNQFI